MTYSNQANLSRTVLDVTITYNNDFLENPIILSSANGKTDIMGIAQSRDQINYDVTASADTDTYMVGVALKGTLTFHPESQAITEISNVISQQEQVAVTVFGSITVSSNSDKFDAYTFSAVVFNTCSFKGYELKEFIEDYTIDFSCRPPKGFNLTKLINSAGGLVKLLS